MKDINFKITEQDIREYLIQHRNDETIKNKEAMFVKYMKENNDITQESLEILMKKYNWDERIIHGTYGYDNFGISKRESLSSFHIYLADIKNLDISGICHIMIPILSYYNDKRGYYCYKCYTELSNLCRKMSIETTYEMKENTVDEMKENYLLGFGNNYVYQQNKDTYFKFSRDKSRKLIQEYSHIYGEEPVKQIRKIIRERV